MTSLLDGDSYSWLAVVRACARVCVRVFGRVKVPSEEEEETGGRERQQAAALDIHVFYSM